MSTDWVINAPKNVARFHELTALLFGGGISAYIKDMAYYSRTGDACECIYPVMKYAALLYVEHGVPTLGAREYRSPNPTAAENYLHELLNVLAITLHSVMDGTIQQPWWRVEIEETPNTVALTTALGFYQPRILQKCTFALEKKNDDVISTAGAWLWGDNKERIKMGLPPSIG